MPLSQPPAPGARALIRDEEWLVQHADQCVHGGWQLACIGVSETVRHRQSLFLTALDDVTLMDPAQTGLVFDQMRGKPRRSGRGRIARTAWPSWV